jgi:hypothetical protein
VLLMLMPGIHRKTADGSAKCECVMNHMDDDDDVGDADCDDGESWFKKSRLKISKHV